MKKPHILIVEDNRWLSEHYERILKQTGYEVTTTGHILAAINVIDDHIPDVIILDVLLTGQTAFTFLHELQSYGDTSIIPVIICTNLAEELNLTDLKPYGVRQILDKTTMIPDDLITTLKAVL